MSSGPMGEAETSYRIAHLLSHVQRTFHNIGLDAIWRQMDLHPVSAAFAPSRLLEMFAMILANEREALILKTEQSLHTAADVRHGWLDRARSDRTESTAALESLCAENLRLRRELNQLKSVDHDNHWKRRKIALDWRTRTDEFKVGFANGVRAAQRIQQDCRDLSELLDGVRHDVASIESAARSSISAAQQTLYSAIFRRVGAMRGHAGVERLEAKLRSERTSTVFRRDRLYALVVGLNCREEGAILRQLRAEVARARRGALGRFPDATAIPCHVRAEIERLIREQEGRYLPMLMKQNASMAKLERELQRAERRLAKLSSVEGGPDPRLEEMLDAERKTMEGAQETTDMLMKKLQEGSFSSTLTEE
jgi:hypothetical protein